MLRKFSFDPSNHNATAAEILDTLRKYLARYKLKQRDENRIISMLEESLLRLMSHSSESCSVRMSVIRLPGTLDISLSMKGESFDNDGMISPVTLAADDDEMKSALEGLIMSSFGDKVKYSHSKGVNRVRISAVKSPYAFLYQTLSAIALAVLLGMLTKTFVPESAYASLNAVVLEPIRDVFMNALMIVVAPIVFFSLVNSVSQYGSLSELGTLGARTIFFFSVIKTIASATAVAIFYVMFYAGFPFSGVIQGGDEAVKTAGGSYTVLAMIINAVPKNFVEPFLKSNVLQLMVLGVLCGIAIGMAGQYSKPLTELFRACDEMFMKMTVILTRFIPLVVLCSIWSVVLKLGTGLLLELGIIAAVNLSGLLLVMFFDCLRVKYAGLSPLRFIRKYSRAMAHVFSTTSSSVSLPENMKAADSMGIPNRIYSLTLPLGVVFSKNGSILYRSLTALLVALLFGIDVTFADVIAAVFTASVITLATPGVPGGAYIAFSALLAALNVPVQSMAYIISIDAVMDIFIAVVNSFGAMVTTLAFSKSDGVLDMEKWNS